MPNVLDNRKSLNFRGDRADHMVGQIVGPNLMGEHWTIVEASYDADADLTRCRLRPTRQDDLAGGAA